MTTMSIADTATLIERLTDVRIDFRDEAIKGRNVWGRPAFRRDGMLHVEILAGDKLVNDAVMPSISDGDKKSNGEERYRLYRKRCKEMAIELNEGAVSENNLVLFVASNGHPTKKFKALVEALL